MRIRWAPCYGEDWPFHGIITALRRFPEQNAVENIVFDINTYKSPDQTIPVVRDYWLPLAESFVTGFPCLKRLMPMWWWRIIRMMMKGLWV